LVDEVESAIIEKDKIAKVVDDLKAQLIESESRLEVSKMRASRKREANKELEEELLVLKRAMEQHEKGFNKAARQAGFFTKDLDLGLFDPFNDVKDGVLLDE